MADVRRALSGTAVLLGVAAVVESAVADAGGSAGTQFVLFSVLLALATTVPLALRPTVAAVAVTAASVLALSISALTVAGAIAAVAVGFRLGRLGHAPISVALGLPYLAVALVQPAGVTRIMAVTLAALAPTAALAGLLRRLAAESASAERTQEALAGTLLEHTARGERARIAHELHDVVAHHISMIAVQAEAARLTTAGMPPAGAQRLSAIGDTARDALTEMRRLLGVLRDSAAPPVPHQPQPGLAQLNDLLDEARDATGAGTRLILQGGPVPLDPGVELAAYRIVQEALTNARRHAPGAAVDVELQFSGSVLRLLIRDNGLGTAVIGGGGGGHGLLGMTERAAAVGGTLRAGPAAGGGFLIKATLPVKTLPVKTLPVTETPVKETPG